MTSVLMFAILMHCALCTEIEASRPRRRLAIKRPQPIEKLNRRATLADQVYESLRNAVIHGHLSPGSRLNQIDLAKNLDVSERTVREALTRLVSEGLVSREPYREFRVVWLSVEEIEEIFHMRALLEGWAMELAAHTITSRELAQMRKSLPKMEASISLESVLTLQGTNREFHWIAINACKKKYLVQMLKRLWNLMLPYAFAEKDTESYVRQMEKDQIYHPQLVNALEVRDGQKAREILATHIHEAMEQLRLRVQRLDTDRERESLSLEGM